MARDSGEPAVDDRHHAVDGHRALGDVGRQDHLGLRLTAHRPILLFRRQLAVQRQHCEVVLTGERRTRFHRAADLAGAWKKDEHVALDPRREDAPGRSSDLLVKGFL